MLQGLPPAHCMTSLTCPSVWSSSLGSGSHWSPVDGQKLNIKPKKTGGKKQYLQTKMIISDIQKVKMIYNLRYKRPHPNAEIMPTDCSFTR